MTAEERVKNSFTSHPDWDMNRRANSLNLPVAVIREHAPGSGASAPVVASKPRGIRVQDMLKKLDYPAKIMDTITTKCRGEFVPEFEFRVMTGLTSNQFRSGVNAGDFARFTTRIEGVTYWSTEENVAKAEAMKSKV